MQQNSYLSNKYISEEYNVSHVTVGKWIKAALEGKNNLEIEQNGKKQVIVDSVNNRHELELLSNKGSKFKNRQGYEELYPSQKIYDVFSGENLIELITYLQSKHQIPLKLSYLGEGAEIWSEYAENDISNENYSYFRKQLDLVYSNLENFLPHIEQYDEVNIIDIGPGEGFLGFNMVKKLQEKGFSTTYSAFDISKRMLDICKQNFAKWDSTIDVKFNELDIDYALLRDHLFYAKSDKQSSKKSCNLILFFGSTIGNVADRHRVLKNFADSMYVDDFLILNNGLRTENESGPIYRHLSNQFIQEGFLYVAKELGIRPELYDIKKNFSYDIDSWAASLKLKKDIDIIIVVSGKEYRISFNQNTEILVWNYFSYPLQTFTKEFNDAGLDVIQLSLSKDKGEIMAICQNQLVVR